MLGEWFDLIFPETCPFCREAVCTPWGVCMDCESTLPWIEPPWCEACGRPLDAGGDPAVLCGDCTLRRPLFHRAFSIVAYDEKAQRAIAAMKYGRDDQMAAALAKILLRSSPGCINPFLYDWVTAVPLHRKRYRWRGFNQAAAVARSYARFFGLRFCASIVERAKATTTQAGLDREGRLQNLAKAFQADAKKAAGKRVLIIDDVMTTGATAEAVAAALLEAGASQADVLTLARAFPGRAP